MRGINKQNLSKTKIKGSDPKSNRKCQKAEKKGFIMKKTISGYAVDHAKKTITLTKAYAKMANVPGTKEFDELASLYKAFPDYTIKMRTATKIDRMEWYIVSVEQDEKALAEFENAKKFYKGMNGYYGKMKKWFLAKYPNYQTVDFAEVDIAG